MDKDGNGKDKEKSSTGKDILTGGGRDGWGEVDMQQQYWL